MQMADSKGSALVLDLLGLARTYEQELAECRQNKQSEVAVESLLQAMEGATDGDIESTLAQLPPECAVRVQKLRANCMTLEESLERADERARKHEEAITKVKDVVYSFVRLQTGSESLDLGLDLDLPSLSLIQDMIAKLLTHLAAIEGKVYGLKVAMQQKTRDVAQNHLQSEQTWATALSTKEQELVASNTLAAELQQALQERDAEIQDMRTTLAEKTDLLEELQQKLDMQMKEYADFKEQYMELETTLRMRTEALQNCESLLKRVDEELLSLQNERDMLSHQVQAEETANSGFSTQIRLLTMQVDDFRAQISTLSEEKLRVTRELAAERLRADEQSHLIESIQSLKEGIEIRLTETLEALAEAGERAHTLQSELQSVTEEKVDLATRLFDLQSELNTKSTVCSNVEASLEMALQAQGELNKTVFALQQTVDQYEQDLKESQEETTTIREQLLAQSLDNAQLQERITAMGEETTRLREALLEQVSDLQMKLVEHKSVTDSTSTQLTAALEDLCHRDHQIEEDRKTILALQADLETKVCQVNEYRAQIETMSQDMQRTLSTAEMDFRTQLMAADQRLEERLAEEASLKDRLVAAEEAQRVFKAKSQELVTKAQEEVELLMEKLEEEKKLTSKQKELLVERRDACEELQQKVDSAIHQIDKLEAALEEAHRERDTMKEEIETIKTQGTEAHRNRLHDQLQLIQEQGRQIEEFRSEYSVIDEGIILSADEVHRVAVTLYQLAKDRRRVDGASTNSSLYMSATSIRETETNLVHQHMRTLEKECELLRDASERMAAYLQAKGTEVGTLQERVGVKEKEVNLLLDLTKSREDRINALLDELNYKNGLIGEQSDTIARLTGEVKRLQTLV
ncbi:Coiled-coil protein [Giardia muris]|uniref:Coiled-coil protein n=1 Tax=Giardia muris TaxID=5742 RepID=A0A4Z1T361_GIAMU|nr:Coiled-coil protein [Giardia muris]|eukprot:TNJ27487.1 Coiled-coil protein [Giardia muris]